MAWVGSKHKPAFRRRFGGRTRLFRGISARRDGVHARIPGTRTGIRGGTIGGIRGATIGGARRWTIGAAFMVVLGAGLPGCHHVPETASAGGAALYGCAQVDVLEALDYSLPQQTYRAGVLVTLGLDEAQGKHTRRLRATTDRSGCFYLDDVKPGRYRVLEIRVPGRQSSSGNAPSPDLEFPLWERTLEMGFEGLSTSLTSEGSLPEAIFDVEEGDVRYLGHFDLSFRKDPYDEPGPCLIRDSLIKGVQGELYFSSDPVGAKLCVEQKPEEARAFLERRLGHRISPDREG